MFTDSHTHLYLDEFRNDIEDVVDHAITSGITRFFLPNIDAGSIPALHKLTDSYPEYCFPMMGLHPCSVKADYEKELQQIREQLGQRKYYAIGEMGLDYYWSTDFVKEQENAFMIQAEWAIEYNLPLVIHSRNATEESMALIRKFNNPNLKGVFHCFSGSEELAAEIIDLGFYIGIGGVLTYPKAGLDLVVKSVPLKSILLETDSPYLAPSPYRGKRNESAYIRIIAEKLANIKNIELGEVAQATTQNAKILFDFPG